MKRRFVLVLAALAVFAAGLSAKATETEHLGMRVLPTPGKVMVDGKFDDWDLSGGIFACGDVENAQSKYAVWFHTMHDKDNLYLLGRFVDPTPMNHPGSVKGDYGFIGDSMQVRVVTAPDVDAKEITNRSHNDDDAEKMRTSHITAWRDRDGLDVIDIAYGRRFNEGGLKDAKTEGAQQAFLKHEDGKGYTQEIAIPWKLLKKDGVEVKPGSRIMLTLEPNFVVGTGGRLTIKDLFRPGVAIDRVFTFQSNRCWGFATLETQGRVQPTPVRLADGREFPVKLEDGMPSVEWTGLIKSRMPEGFKTIKFTLPEDGYVSLNLFAPDGSVARQLLTSHFLTKGEHEIKWDGLGTMSFRTPGEAVSPGEYRWEGFYHKGIGLQLRGWAANSGAAPWRGWGADHGNPKAVAAAGDRVFAGWDAGEGDKPLLAADLSGNVQWKNIRGGIAGASLVASDGVNVYTFNPVGQYAKKAIYRVDAQSGRYTEWTDLKSTDLTMQDIWPGEEKVPEGPSSIAAAGGKVFASFSDKNAVKVIDAATGAIVGKLAVEKAGALATGDGKLLYVVAKDGDVVAIDVESGAEKLRFRPQFEHGDWASCLALDKAGNLYVGIRGDHHHVLAYNAKGELQRQIGRTDGRALTGPWTKDGMLNPSGIAVDSAGKLWVAEDDGQPRRVSVWNTADGSFNMELFGASSYGATGCIVDPKDPYRMVGMGCEWRIDPKTAKAECLGTITREGMGACRFGFGKGGRQYLATTPTFLHGPGDTSIYERLGDANYKLRTTLRRTGNNKKVEIWADANDDAQRQDSEVKSYDIDLGGWINGWYMSMSPDLSFYGSLYQLKVTDWTACGAPVYDVAAAKKLPAPSDVGHRGGMGAQRGHGSADGRYMLWNGGYGLDHATVDCYDIATGKLAWKYPSNFTGVHGSHRACGPETGMIRGAYDICGVAKLPDPIGNIWIIPTNKGEWHVLTEKGFYLTKFFESDPTRVVFPDQAVPGVSLDTCPPGAGEEAFGGSITQGVDGSLTVQAGHISFWNCAVVGLDTVKPLSGGKVSIGGDDVRLANEFRGRYLQEAAKGRQLVAKRGTPTFTGNLDKDFGDAVKIDYEKDEAAAVRTAISWDDKNLYVGWNVKDGTPWVNGADAPEFMYARGDTVDVQLGVDASADKERKEGVQGDVRISIGQFDGHPTVVAYRKVAKDNKAPKQFSSGVVKGYEMESVVVLKDVHVEVQPDPVAKRYTIEAAIPWSAIGVTPKSGLTLRGDFGVTHGDKDGRDTVLRTHWSNQNTGLVSDEVFELQMTPANWGEIELK